MTGKSARNCIMYQVGLFTEVVLLTAKSRLSLVGNVRVLAD